MTYRIESIPTTWDDQRDGQFFRLVAGVLADPFGYGAGVLLATYDQGPSIGAGLPTSSNRSSLPAQQQQ